MLCISGSSLVVRDHLTIFAGVVVRHFGLLGCPFFCRLPFQGLTAQAFGWLYAKQLSGLVRRVSVFVALLCLQRIDQRWLAATFRFPKFVVWGILRGVRGATPRTNKSIGIIFRAI